MKPSSQSGSGESGLRSCAMPAIEAAASSSPMLEPLDRGVAGVHRAHRLERRPAPRRARARGSARRRRRAATGTARGGAAPRRPARARPGHVGERRRRLARLRRPQRPAVARAVARRPGTAAASAASSSRVRSGGRAITQAAAISPISALAGTNQVQSTSELTPKTSAIAISVAMPTRSASHGSPRSRGAAPAARSAAQPQRPSASSDSASPAQPRSAIVCGT